MLYELAFNGGHMRANIDGRILPGVDLAEVDLYFARRSTSFRVVQLAPRMTGESASALKDRIASHYNDCSTHYFELCAFHLAGF
jgi:hypothetical protein